MIKNIDELKLEWTYYPSKLLYNKCKTIDEEDFELSLEIGSKMKTMLAEQNGLGLAANQAGLDICMAIVAFPDENGDYRVLKTLINPEIVFESPKKINSEEGCLSFPELFVEIERPYEIVVRAQLEDKGMMNIQARGLLARILCHEIDHLNGITMPDRLTPINREIIQPQLDKIEEEFGSEE
ncbi:MAG: peptide deformylase [Candidatus Zixiibacteriota bacterium]